MLESVTDKATLLSVASKWDLFEFEATLKRVAHMATLLRVGKKRGLFSFWLCF